MKVRRHIVTAISISNNFYVDAIDYWSGRCDYHRNHRCCDREDREVKLTIRRNGPFA